LQDARKAARVAGLLLVLMVVVNYSLPRPRSAMNRRLVHMAWFIIIKNTPLFKVVVCVALPTRAIVPRPSCPPQQQQTQQQPKPPDSGDSQGN